MSSLLPFSTLPLTARSPSHFAKRSCLQVARLGVWKAHHLSLNFKDAWRSSNLSTSDMENYDRCDRPLNQTAGSKSQAQSARAQSAPDEVSRDTNPGDQLSISFSKGPKRKRLAKVRSTGASILALCSLTLRTRPATPVTKVNAVVMGLVSGFALNQYTFV